MEPRYTRPAAPVMNRLRLIVVEKKKKKKRKKWKR
jgi:hypothetical protein